MARDDCPYLRASAHDGAWEMTCLLIDVREDNECKTNWEEYRTRCQRYINQQKRMRGE